MCEQLMQKTKNTLNSESLLNMRTIEEFDMGGWKVRARVAAIHIAAYSGNSGVVRLLCQDYGADVNCSTGETLEEEPKKNITPLQWAARRGHTEVVEVLLDNKVNVHAYTNDGVTALHLAAGNGHTKVVKLLLANKADVNASTNDGITSLHISAGNGYMYTQVVSTQPCIPPGSLNRVPASAGGKGGILTSAGWQVTLCDPIWHVSFP